MTSNFQRPSSIVASVPMLAQSMAVALPGHCGGKDACLRFLSKGGMLGGMFDDVGDEH